MKGNTSPIRLRKSCRSDGQSGSNPLGTASRAGSPPTFRGYEPLVFSHATIATHKSSNVREVLVEQVDHPQFIETSGAVKAKSSLTLIAVADDYQILFEIETRAKRWGVRRYLFCAVRIILTISPILAVDTIVCSAVATTVGAFFSGGSLSTRLTMTSFSDGMTITICTPAPLATY